jgi:hypothetical protein
LGTRQPDSTQRISPDLLAVKRVLASRFLGNSAPGNLLAVGIGEKVVGNRPDKVVCVRAYVQLKLPLKRLPVALRVPEYIEGIPTDVIEIAREGALQRSPAAEAYAAGPGCRVRIKTGMPNVNSRSMGVFGALVLDLAGTRHLLSCNHVLAFNGRVPCGSQIVATGYGNFNEEPVGTFEGRFVKLLGNRDNKVDCALARVSSARLAPRFPGFGNLASGTLELAVPGMNVVKTGGATGLRHGIIVDMSADVLVNFSFGAFRFADQILIDGNLPGQTGSVFATNGDSGSVVIDTAARRAVGMVFAEAGRLAVASPLGEVLKGLEQSSASEEVAGLNLVV